MTVFRPRDPDYVAVILASSVGARLYPLTSTNLPKHLLPLGGTPILLRLIDGLKNSRVTQSVVCIRSDDTSTLEAMRSMDGVQEMTGEQDDKATVLLIEPTMKITVITLSSDCLGSIQALREADPFIPTSSNLLVLSNDLVLNNHNEFNTLIQAHRSNDKVACVIMLTDVGEQDENGLPLKESAKQKQGGLARDDEEIEYMALHYKESGALPRVVWKQSKIDVEQDEHMVGDTPKLVLPKARLRGGLTRVRTEWNDVHAYVFSTWVRQLVKERDSLLTVMGDLVPLLVARQLRSVASAFGSVGAEADSQQKPFEVLAHIQEDARRAFSVNSYLHASKDFLYHHATASPPTKGLLPVDADVRSKSHSIVLPGTKLGEKIVLNTSIIGRNCALGNKCRLNNVVVMDNTTIGDNVTLQNTIIGFKCKIGDMCSLKDCQVAPGKELAPSTKEKGEALVHDDLLP